MDRIEDGITNFKKEFDIQMKERNDNYTIEQVRGEQILLGESNISAIKPLGQSIDLHASQQSNPSQQFSNFAERFAAIEQMSPSKVYANSNQHEQRYNPQNLENNVPQPYQTAQFNQGFSQQKNMRYQQQNIKNTENNEINETESKELLTITIEIGDGHNENIYINEGDSPRALAINFAKRHGINEQLTDLLAEQIRMNIEQIQESKEDSVGAADDDTFGHKTNQSETRGSYQTGGVPNEQQQQYQNLQMNINPVQNQYSNVTPPALSSKPVYDEKLDEVESILSGDNFNAHQRLEIKKNEVTNTDDINNIISTQIASIDTVPGFSKRGTNGANMMTTNSSNQQSRSQQQYQQTGRISDQQMHQRQPLTQTNMHNVQNPNEIQQPQYVMKSDITSFNIPTKSMPTNTNMTQEQSNPNTTDEQSMKLNQMRYMQSQQPTTYMNTQQPTTFQMNSLQGNTIDQSQLSTMGRTLQNTPPMEEANNMVNMINQNADIHFDDSMQQQQQQNINQSRELPAQSQLQEPVINSQNQTSSLDHLTNNFPNAMSQNSNYPKNITRDEQQKWQNIDYEKLNKPIDYNMTMNQQVSDRNAFMNSDPGIVLDSQVDDYQYSNQESMNQNMQDQMRLGVGGNNIIDPNSQAYLNWYRGLNQKLDKGRSSVEQTKDGVQAKPQINHRSQQIIEQKRYGSGRTSGNGQPPQPYNVHNRLYQHGMAKQKQRRKLSQDMNQSNQDTESQQERGRNWRSLPRGSQGSTQEFTEQKNYTSSSNLKLPKNQQMMPRQKPQTMRLRSASVQNTRIIEANNRQGFNTAYKNNYSDGPNSQRGNNSSRGNYGHQLYERGMRRKEEFKLAAKRARSEFDRREEEQLTFAPYINPLSRRLMRQNNEKPEDFLLKYGKAVKEKLDVQRLEQSRKEVEGLTFKPVVSKQSSNIMRQKEQNNFSKFNKFDSLYQDAQRRQERQEFIYSACIESECTFQPDTEKTKYFNAQASQTQKNSSNYKQVFQRLASHRLSSSNDRRKLYMENSRGLNNELFDPDTGQQLFRPRTGRAPRGVRGRSRSIRENTQEHLYRQGMQSRERKQQIQKENDQNIKMKQQQTFSQNKTNKLMTKKKTLNFAKIFELLDSDHDGQVSAYRIDITKIEAELLQVLTPLFVEMEDLGMSLDKDEFIDAATRLYDTVSLPEKNIMLSRKPPQNQQPVQQRSNSRDRRDFKPQLNPNSLKIAEKMRMGDSRSNNSVQDRLMDKQKEYDRKRSERANQALNNEMNQCTFYPNLGPQMMSPMNQSNGGNGSFQNSGFSQRQMQMQKNEFMVKHGMNSMNSVSADNMPSLSQANAMHNGIDINQMAKQVVQDVFKQNQQQTSPQNQYLLPLQMNDNSDKQQFRPPLYQSNMMRNHQNKQSSGRQDEDVYTATNIQVNQKNMMKPRQGSGSLESGGTLKENQMSLKTNQSQKEIQSQLNSQNQLMYVNQLQGQDPAQLKQNIKYNQQMTNNTLSDNLITTFKNTSNDDNSQLSTQQQNDDFQSASTGPGFQNGKTISGPKLMLTRESIQSQMTGQPQQNQSKNFVMQTFN